MLVFENIYAKIIFAIAITLAIGGLLKFLAQVIRWDAEYENFIVSPLRLAIYAVPYLLLPGLGILIGGILLNSKKRVRRKFAWASIYASCMGLMFWVSAMYAGIR